MRKNLPVTGNEIRVREDSILISKTDLKGIINYASHDFIELSGFASGELIGQPHNIVRHPDMPEWVFEDLWTTVKSGYPWTGVVKNRCKNGDYYWVYAEVSPLKKENAIIGYMSNRYRATPEQMRTAEQLYRSSGPPKKKRSLFARLHISIRMRMNAMIFLGILFLAVMSGLLYYSFYRLQTGSRRALQVAELSRETETRFQNQIYDWNRFVGTKDRSGYVEEQKSKVDQGGEEIRKGLERLKAIIRDSEGADTGKILSMVDGLLADSRTIHEHFHSQLGDETGASVKREEELDQKIRNDFNRLSRDVSVHFQASVQQDEKIHLIVILFSMSVGIFLLAFLPVYVGRTFLKPVHAVEHVANRMSEGDLTARIFVEGSDEMARLLTAIKVMGINLRGLTSQILDTSRISAHSADQLSHHAVMLTEAAREQVAATEETSAAVEQLTSSAEHVVQIIHRQTENVESNRSNSMKMVESMLNMEKSMEDLKGLARESADRASSGENTINQAVSAMQEIKVQAARIGEIVNLITEISEQTNLLSLNAAIEAARAGEGGRGFAVVADEISHLADRTAQSIKEIEKLVRLTTQAVENGSNQFTVAAGNFKDIIHRVTIIDTSAGNLMQTVKSQVEMADRIGQTTKKVTEIALEIENAAEEQKRAMNEINENIQSISERSQNVGSSAEDLAVLVHEMAEQSEFLRGLVTQFKVK